MPRFLVPIILPSKADYPLGETLSKELATFGISSELRVASAAKSPELLAATLRDYEADVNATKVYVVVSSRATSLVGFVDHHVSAPVIFCPVASETAASEVYSGMKAVVGPSALVVLDLVGVALAAAKLFAISSSDMKERINRHHFSTSSSIRVQDLECKTLSYLPRIHANIGRTFGASDLKLVPQPGKTVDKYIGKVRDRYHDGSNVILITTDRLTGFDRPLAQIPFKGAVLNLVSKFWFDETQHIIKNHIVSVPHPNVTIGVSAKPFPIEFVCRAYITGSSGTSMWTHYQAGAREYCGHILPDGLVHNQKLEKNIITPTTKSDEHDELISPKEIVERGYMTQEEWDYCSAKALELFAHGQKVALKHGMILVDTKMEMGRNEQGEIILIDELFTPDSSRYWIAASYDAAMAAGKSPENIDKEFVRLWFREQCDPYKDEVLPQAPAKIIAELSRRYLLLYELITGKAFPFPSDTASPNEAVQRALDNLRSGKPTASNSSKELQTLAPSLDLLASLNKYVVIDVREPAERLEAAGSVPTSINVPLQTILDGNGSNIPRADPSKPILFVCRSGKRSLKAAEHCANQPNLADATIINLEGGTLGWVAAGLTTVHQQQ